VSTVWKAASAKGFIGAVRQISIEGIRAFSLGDVTTRGIDIVIIREVR